MAFKNINLFLLSLVFFFLSACLLEHQRPNNIFKSGQFPQALFEKANPSPETTLKKSNMDEKSLRVAVIDNGVDYNHLWLRDQIAYNWSGDQIVGAGRDFLGDDNWAHPNLIDASLFAFGAQELQGGLIVSPLPDPIVKILEINKKFHHALEKRWSQFPDLKDSLFAKKVNIKSLSVLGARSLIGDYYDNVKDRKEAREEYFTKKPGEAWKRYIRQVDTEDSDKDNYFREEFGPYAYSKLFESAWHMDSQYNLPKVILGRRRLYTSVSKLYYLPEFVELLHAAYKDIEKEYDSTYQTYFDYRKSRDDNQGRSDEEYNLEYEKKLAEVIYHSQFGYAYLDPLVNYRDSFCQLLTATEMADMSSPVVNNDVKKSLMQAKIVDLFSLLKKVDTELVSAQWIKARERKNALEQLESYDDLQQFVKTVALDRGTDAFNCLVNDHNNLRQWPKYLAHFEAAHGFYFSGRNASTSHGTHVAGVIASQNSNLKIVPIRVITSQVQASELRTSKIQSSYLPSFKSWLQLKPVKDFILKEYVDSFPSSSGLLPTDDEIFNALEPHFYTEYDSKRLNYLFFEEIRRAIQYVGESKIKVANMSLGAEMTRAIASGQQMSMKEIFDFLDFEFMKYSIGQTIQKYAQGTLFVIAAGNSGKWVNGKARSALPCDISSPVLKEFDPSESLPNNQVNNILCVGSVGPKGDLSPFTNILLTQTPMIFAIGEAVNSTMKTTDCTGADDFFEQRYGRLSYPYLSIFNQNVKDLAKKLNFFPANYSQLDPDEQEEASEYAVRNLQKRIETEATSLVEVSKKHFCLRRSHKIGVMSGTSMASPGVAGYIGQWLQEKMVDAGLSEAELYDKPEFAPEKIIDSVSDDGASFGSKLFTAKKIDQIKTVADINPLKDWLDDYNKQLKANKKTGFIRVQQN